MIEKETIWQHLFMWRKLIDDHIDEMIRALSDGRTPEEMLAKQRAMLARFAEVAEDHERVCAYMNDEPVTPKVHYATITLTGESAV